MSNKDEYPKGLKGSEINQDRESIKQIDLSSRSIEQVFKAISHYEDSKKSNEKWFKKPEIWSMIITAIIAAGTLVVLFLQLETFNTQVGISKHQDELLTVQDTILGRQLEALNEQATLSGLQITESRNANKINQTMANAAVGSYKYADMQTIIANTPQINIIPYIGFGRSQRKRIINDTATKVSREPDLFMITVKNGAAVPLSKISCNVKVFFSKSSEMGNETENDTISASNQFPSLEQKDLPKTCAIPPITYSADTVEMIKNKKISIFLFGDVSYFVGKYGPWIYDYCFIYGPTGGSMKPCADRNGYASRPANYFPIK